MGNLRPLIAGNWKMFKTCNEAVETAKKLVLFSADVTEVDVMIAPPFTSLAPVSEILKHSDISLGAQDIFWESEGAYTGEISPPMLLSAGCKHVIIGHSERRQYFNETDQTVNKKISAAVHHHLSPIFCVGETERQRESKETFSVLDKQIQNGLRGISSDDMKEVIVAYEPVWAIGTGKTATSEQVQEIHQFIRSLLERSFGSVLAKSIRILYGGSVKPTNVKELMSMKDVNGALVGGASLNPETFSDIIHNYK